jgi:hypothetical protein
METMVRRDPSQTYLESLLAGRRLGQEWIGKAQPNQVAAVKQLVSAMCLVVWVCVSGPVLGTDNPNRRAGIEERLALPR